MFLPDTNILVNYLKGLEPEKSFIKEQIIADSLRLSPIVVAEYFAKAEKKEEDLLKDLIAATPVLPIETETAFVAGEYRKQFSRKTKKTYLPDCFIAATCKIHELTLITNNIKDYPMKDIKILKPSQS